MNIPEAKVNSTLPTLLASKQFIHGTGSAAVLKATLEASSKDQVKYRMDLEKSSKKASSSRILHFGMSSFCCGPRNAQPVEETVLPAMETHHTHAQSVTFQHVSTVDGLKPEPVESSLNESASKMPCRCQRRSKRSKLCAPAPPGQPRPWLEKHFETRTNVQLTVTPTVLGGGGIWERKAWTNDSKRIRDEGLKIYAKQNKNASLTKDQEDVLTPWRCELYTWPKERPEALAEMLMHHAKLFSKDIHLEGSLRIAGHTKKGATCLLAEVGSTRNSFNDYLDQAINLLTLAADMSKPTSGGQAGFYCVNYMPGMSLTQFLNPASAFTMSKLLKNMWRNQLEGFLLVDMPPAFQWFLNLVLKAIPAETREKFKVISYEDSLLEIQKTCEPEFLQEYQRCVTREKEVLQSKDHSMRKWDVICSLPFFVNHPRIKALNLSHKTCKLSRDQFHVFHECSKEWLEKGCPNFWM